MSADGMPHSADDRGSRERDGANTGGGLWSDLSKRAGALPLDRLAKAPSRRLWPHAPYRGFARRNSCSDPDLVGVVCTGGNLEADVRVAGGLSLASMDGTSLFSRERGDRLAVILFEADLLSIGRVYEGEAIATADLAGWLGIIPDEVTQVCLVPVRVCGDPPCLPADAFDDPQEIGMIVDGIADVVISNPTPVVTSRDPILDGDALCFCHGDGGDCSVIELGDASGAVMLPDARREDLRRCVMRAAALSVKDALMSSWVYQRVFASGYLGSAGSDGDRASYPIGSGMDGEATLISSYGDLASTITFDRVRTDDPVFGSLPRQDIDAHISGRGELFDPLGESALSDEDRERVESLLGIMRDIRQVDAVWRKVVPAEELERIGSEAGASIPCKREGELLDAAQSIGLAYGVDGWMDAIAEGKVHPEDAF